MPPSLLPSLNESVILEEENMSLESELDQVITTYNAGSISLQSIDDSSEEKNSRLKSTYTFLRISFVVLVIVIKALNGS